MVDDFEDLDVISKDVNLALKLVELQTTVHMLQEKDLGRVAQIQALETKLKEKNEKASIVMSCHESCDLF